MSGDGTSLLTLIAGALVCGAPFDCDRSFDKYGGILVWLALMLYMFKALGAICDEYFVPSLEVIVEKLQLSNDVAGATFMAAGSSAPELFTSLVATFLIVNEGGVGTIVGSAIFNILIIVGVTCYVACKDEQLPIWWYPLSRDAFFYALSIVELMIILSDEEVRWYEGLIMVFSYVIYCIYMKFNPAIVDALGLKAPGREELVEEADHVQEEVKEGGAHAASLKIELSGCGGEGGALKEATVAEKAPGPPEHHLGRTVDPNQIGKNGTETNPGTVDDSHADPKAVSVPAGPVPELKVSPRVSWSAYELKHSPRGSPRGEQDQASKEHNPEHAVAATGSTGVTWGHKRTSCNLATLEGGGAAPESVELEEEVKTCSWKDPSSWPIRDPLLWFWEVTMPTPENHYWILFTLSIVYIGCCTYVMVDATARVGTILHIPTLAMALVFLAAGTSIPDALGSVAVAKQGEGDMAVANALGSNVFDILVGLGIPWTIKNAMGKEVKFEGKWKELVWDIVILCFVLILFIGALFVNRWYLTRRIGIVLLSFYVLFLIYALPLSVWVFELKKVDDS